ncbi:FtsX-like permease family protein [Streptococcus himalayensis]|uniref:ABC transporter permease n=1 Tax=Streptococcus himalayensis TaxID=1888195 RepID=A0A917A7H7_9STRE|nr:FtsX-like permease family protein [Streptococcus himalayensis]GGE31941.1 ABC transporter permease [Streptococcus himalayensis]
MFSLTSKLAVSNLIKNRRLYTPFALSTMVATAILYIFVALAHSPHLEESYGGSPARSVLQFGIFIIQLAVLFMVVYANSFVIKNRSKELGLYSILGMERRHLLLMTFVELFLFFLGTVGAGLGLGLVLDKLLFAFLLKITNLPVVIVSSFQWSSVFLTLGSLGVIFLVIVAINSLRLWRYSSLNLLKEKKAGEKKARFLGLQTLLGLVLLGTAYGIALTVTRPVVAIPYFFLAVLLVILASYLLFNAGTITLLQGLKRHQSYYYQPKNMIAVSNLMARMRKNAAGLATISIVSTMLLVTLTGSISIFVGQKDYLNTLYPHDYNISRYYVDRDGTESYLNLIKDSAKKAGLTDPQFTSIFYQQHSLEQISGNHLTLINELKEETDIAGLVLTFSEKDYQALTGETVSLKEDEVLAFGQKVSLDPQKPLTIESKEWKVRSFSKKDILQSKISNASKLYLDKILVLVVKDAAMLAPDAKTVYYVGVDSKDKENQAFMQAVHDRQKKGESLMTAVRADIEHESLSVVGTLLFIGIFLSLVFLLGTVLVIYYKQISEGYEDRENFVILQQVGLDEGATRATIRKQILTVFFLPLLFSFLHLAVAFKMISLIVMMLGATNTPLLVQTTVIVCLLFLLVYMLVFWLTSRSYQTIVSRSRLSKM